MSRNGNGHAAEVLAGEVEAVNDRGVRIDGKWWNRSRWAKLEQIDAVTPGERVELRLDGSGFIRVLTRLDAPEPAVPPTPEPELAAPQPAAPPSPIVLERELLIIRQCALKAATDFVASRPELRSCDLFALAERMEAWVTR